MSKIQTKGQNGDLVKRLNELDKRRNSLLLLQIEKKGGSKDEVQFLERENVTSL